MSTAYWITGDTLDTLRQMPDGCVDLVLTSPPFLALRSYLPAEDPAKAQEIGQEATPGAFLDVLLDITEELRRVLAPHGSIAIELGDTYSGSGGAGGDYTDGGMRDGQPAFKGSAARDRPQDDTDGTMKYARVPSDGRPPIRDLNGKRQGGGDGWPEAKSLCLIPELYRMALAYGRNPLTGRECSRWRIRNVVRWVRPNPPVGALGDKYRPATSEMVVATMARDRYFDLDAVREPPNPHSVKYGDAKTRARHGHDGYKVDTRGDGGRMTHGLNPAGAPPLDWWEIPTHPYKGSHYATWPPALCERPIKSMVPQRVCTVCGEPSRRIVENSPEYQAFRDEQNADYAAGRNEKLGARAQALSQTTPTGASVGGWNNVDHKIRNAEKITAGWSDCGHNAWRPGRVLDIFAGSGTTLAVATGHGRDAIGVDLDQRNADLARERVGMWFEHVTVEELPALLGTQSDAA